MVNGWITTEATTEKDYSGRNLLTPRAWPWSSGGQGSRDMYHPGPEREREKCNCIENYDVKPNNYLVKLIINWVIPFQIDQ